MLENQETALQKIHIGFLILIVLPFLILIYFNHPTPEDFYYEEIVKSMGFYDAQRFFFKFWGGRFSYYALISINPLILNSVLGYNLAILLMIALFFSALYFFLSAFTRECLRPGERLMLSSAIIFLYLYSMPSVGQGFYWLGSSINYNLSVVFIFLFYMSYKRLIDVSYLKKRRLYLSICLLLSALIAGFNEIAAIIFMLSLIILLLKNLVTDKKFNLQLTIILLVNLISAYIAFTAPGNSGRSAHYAGNHDFLNSLSGSVIFVFKQSFLWVFDSPLIPVTIMLIPLFIRIAGQGNPASALFTVNPLFPAAIVVLFLFAGSFVMIWSSGILPYDRILNSLFFIFLLGWFYIVATCVFHFRERMKFYDLRYSRFLTPLSIAAVLFFLIRDNNIKTAYTEILNGKAMEFSDEMNERYIYLSTDSCDSCIVRDRVAAPMSLFLMDIDENPGSVYNIGYARYFNKSSIILKENK